MARSYKRDSRGRFAGGGGGGSGGSRSKSVKLPAPAARKVGSKPQRRRGLLIDRGRLARSEAKLKAKDPADQTIKGQLSRRSQKGAVTRGKNALAAAEQRGRIRLGARSGVIRPRRGTAELPVEERRRANSIRKGNLIRTTPAMELQRQQNLATAQRALDAIRRNPPRNSLYGLDRNKIRDAEMRVEGLSGPLPKYRKPNRAAQVLAARDNIARKRAEKRNRKFIRSMETARRAGAYYRETGTLPASMRPKPKAASARAKGGVIGAKRSGGAKKATVPAEPASRVVARGTGRKIRMPSAPNRIPNRTGQSKTLNKFNSRPERTRGAYVGGRYVPKERLKGRQPLDLTRGDDRAFGRTATTSMRARQAGVAKKQQRQTTEQRRSVAEAKQKALIAPLVGTRKRGTKKQRRSIQTLERAKSFYGRGNNVDTLFVDVKRPGFRLPRSNRS